MSVKFVFTIFLQNLSYLRHRTGDCTWNAHRKLNLALKITRKLTVTSSFTVIKQNVAIALIILKNITINVMVADIFINVTFYAMA